MRPLLQRISRATRPKPLNTYPYPHGSLRSNQQVHSFSCSTVSSSTAPSRTAGSDDDDDDDDNDDDDDSINALAQLSTFGNCSQSHLSASHSSPSVPKASHIFADTHIASMPAERPISKIERS